MDQTSAPKTRLIEADCWVFDLDNTLYPSSSDLFPQVDKRMTRFIADFLDLNIQEAGELRRAYYLEYGTTLSGLMALHDMRPEAFLDFVHDVDLGVVTPDPLLDQALSSIPGRKVILPTDPPTMRNEFWRGYPSAIISKTFMTSSAPNTPPNPSPNPMTLWFAVAN